MEKKVFFFVISRQNLKDECENFAFLIANKILIGVILAKVSFLKSPKNTFFQKISRSKGGVTAISRPLKFDIHKHINAKFDRKTQTFRFSNMAFRRPYDVFYVT